MPPTTNYSLPTTPSLTAWLPDASSTLNLNAGDIAGVQGAGAVAGARSDAVVAVTEAEGRYTATALPSEAEAAALLTMEAEAAALLTMKAEAAAPLLLPLVPKLVALLTSKCAQPTD